jgi:hypothetical protein
LKTHQAVEILPNEWRVTDVVGDVQTGREWREPALKKSPVIVWRRDAEVYYRALEDAEAKARVLLSEGASFANICEVIGALTTRTDQVALIGRLLAQWLAEGIFTLADAALTTSPTASRI